MTFSDNGPGIYFERNTAVKISLFILFTSLDIFTAYISYILYKFSSAKKSTGPKYSHQPLPKILIKVGCGSYRLLQQDVTGFQMAVSLVFSLTR